MLKKEDRRPVRHDLSRRDDCGTISARRSAEEGSDGLRNSGGGNGSETDPANDCDPGNSGGNNNGKD